MRKKERLEKKREEKAFKKTSVWRGASSRITQTEMYLKSAEESIQKGNDDLHFVWKRLWNRNAIQ